MNGITELAKLLKERDNTGNYSPMFGTIIELPVLKVRLSDKILLTDAHIKKRCVFVEEQDNFGRYIHLGKEAVLLPYSNEQKFVLVGLVM